jgi:hypothetical protein
MPQTARPIILITLLTLVASLSASVASPPTWHAYTFRDGAFNPLAHTPTPTHPHSPTCQLTNLPISWHILAALHADLTHDGIPECTLLVWRPWQDWPIMQWSDTPSPIAANRDAHGDSAHIILVEPTADGRQRSAVSDQRSAYRELWAGSALAVPIIQIAAGDVDGDGWDELVALEGDYASGRYGPARHVAVWRWNGFGFTLEWRGPPRRLVALVLADLDGDGVVEILTR